MRLREPLLRIFLEGGKGSAVGDVRWFSDDPAWFVRRWMTLARQRRHDLTDEEFAHAIESRLGYPVPVGTLRTWLAGVSPPGDALMAALMLAGLDVGQLQGLGTADSLDSDVKRRRFVGLGTALAGAAFLPPVEPLIDSENVERLVRALRRRVVDDQVVVGLEAISAQHREMYHRLGSFEMMEAVRGHLRSARLLLEGRQSPTSRRRLAAVVGEEAGHAAWLACDLGDATAAERYYALALAATEEAGDPVLGAYIQGFRGLVRLAQGRPREALTLTQGAAENSARGGTATMRAWLAGSEAQVAAVMQDGQSCREALGRAYHELDRSRPENDAPWMYSFDSWRLAAVAGSCYGALGETTAAEENFSVALALVGRRGPRGRAEMFLDLAGVYLQKRDIEQVCGWTRRSLAAALESDSAAGLDRIRQFRGHLDPWSDSPDVQDLDHELSRAWAL